MPYEYRVTFIFSGFQTGWTETHVFSRQEADPGAVGGALTQLAQKRANMLGREYQMDGFRVKLYRDPAGNRVRRTAFPVEGPFIPQDQTAANKGDPAFVACRALGADVTGQHVTRVFLGGIPDVCSDAGGAFDKSKGGFDDKFKSWVNEGIAQAMGYYSFPILTQGPVNNYVVQPDFSVIYTVPTGVLGPDDLGRRVQARVSGLNNQKSILNRPQVVQVNSLTAIQTVKAHAAGPFQSIGHITLYETIPALYLIAGWQIAPRCARHKRGRPLSVSPGRNRPLVLV